MNAAWSYFWPIFAAGLLVGAICGLVAFRRRARGNLALVIGIALSLAVASLWHGPLGAADRFVSQVEGNARATINYNEIPEVTAHLHRGPLTRRLALSGPANDFQRSELVRIMGDLPGVSTASWSGADGGLPLIAEACIVAAAGFLLGLLLAYLVELRRRFNAQWKW
jgi:hypothetical protein